VCAIYLGSFVKMITKKCKTKILTLVVRDVATQISIVVKINITIKLRTRLERNRYLEKE